MTLSSLMVVAIPLLSALFSGIIAAKAGAGMQSVVFAAIGLGLGVGLGSLPIAYAETALMRKRWQPKTALETAYYLCMVFSVFIIPILVAGLVDLIVKHLFVPKP